MGSLIRKKDESYLDCSHLFILYQFLSHPQEKKGVWAVPYSGDGKTQSGENTCLGEPHHSRFFCSCGNYRRFSALQRGRRYLCQNYGRTGGIFYAY